ncbi:MAG: regulatory protein RecX [Dokdonella sp.]|uniref:regulatory protein RecX n=1 Tax=Dokdonella sp. TaxID=2291710 RepID=UPI0027B8E72A|nr:regulatory protein RecX [Dokdonella sp.]MCW5578539.1 regulatory protein RecX [Dokdonella sp.]
MSPSRRRPAQQRSDNAASRDGYADALQMLARREHSTRELATRLARRGHDADEAEAAIARLREQHYQSDERFAAALARHRAGQGYGPLRIRAELRSHGLAEAAIGGALDELGADWLANAAAQLRRHAGGKAIAGAPARARAAAFLLRRGFDAATVRALTRADLADPDAEPA